MNRLMSFMSGATMGFLVGATLSLLLTPESGEELRNKFQEQTRRVQEEVKTAAQNRRIELEKQLSTLREPQKSS